MAGTKGGGLKARDTNYARHGKDFYRNIGRIGGKLGRTGGFASRAEHTCEVFSFPHRVAQCAGRKGGVISRRGPILGK